MPRVTRKPDELKALEQEFVKTHGEFVSTNRACKIIGVRAHDADYIGSVLSSLHKYTLPGYRFPKYSTRELAQLVYSIHMM